METQKKLRSQNNFEKEQSGRNYALCNQNNVNSNQDSTVFKQKQTQRLMKWIEAPEINLCTYAKGSKNIQWRESLKLDNYR